MSLLDGSDTGIMNRSKRTYVAVTDTTAFFSYTVAMNTTTYVNTGTLAANGTTITRGTLLRENGKKLYPDANPGITKFYVGVYLTESPFTSGFIDPNAGFFVLYNGDKPTYLGGSSDFVGLAGGTPTIPSLTTVGAVTAGTGVVATTGGVVATAGPLRAATVTENSTTTSGALTFNPTLGNVFKFTATLNGAVTLASSTVANTAGQVVYVFITSGGGQSLTDGTNVDLNGTITLTASKKICITLVSDGTTFTQANAQLIFS